MASKQKNLSNAKSKKNDEFYTQLTDIEKELHHYKEQFKDKVVYCNCDDPTESNFVKYFLLNFEHFELKKLIATHFSDNHKVYKLEYSGKEVYSDVEELLVPLSSSGDFRSQESIEFLKEADIVVTNPPFSLFREYLAQLIEYDKQFLIMSSMNAITYKETFKLCNLTSGGEGSSGFSKPPISEATRLRMSTAQQGNTNSIGNQNWLGKHHTDDEKRKISEANIGNTNWLGKKHSDKSKDKISARFRGVPKTEEHRVHLAEANLGKRASDGTRLKMSLAQKRRRQKS